MEKPPSIHIDALVETIDSTTNPAFVHHMKETLTWLAKRQEYSHEYYRQLKRYSSQDKLEEALWMFDHVTRVRFEAAALAFIQNIHAACDAFPFALHILLGGLSDRENREDEHFKWNRALIKQVEQKFPDAVVLAENLRVFMDDVNFRILASLVNQAKHKYFPRIRCEYDATDARYHLRIRDFEYVCYPNGKKEKRTIDVLDVLDFAKTIHDDTLVKIYRLYLLSYDCVKLGQ
jgi:hypothetical protein